MKLSQQESRHNKETIASLEQCLDYIIKQATEEETTDQKQITQLLESARNDRSTLQALQTLSESEKQLEEIVVTNKSINHANKLAHVRKSFDSVVRELNN